MSFQRFFRSYPYLCGMTGTAADATGEMQSVYARPVIVVPTNRPVIREHWPARIFRTHEAKWSAIAQSIDDLHRAGRPILAGTRSIHASEHLGQKLTARALPHRVLNANFDKEEAELISAAGHGWHASEPREAGAEPSPEPSITVATNMAGRGTDIKPDESALKAGGLHVILTEMHTAKRIDRQFIGRSGRQGDPGSAQIFVSLEDELPRLYARRLAEALKATAATEELDGSLRALAVRLFRLAQRRAEARARRNRAEVLKQDDWIEKHLPGM
jgi:preprotein translocase subunit SecA